ncbi:MAG: cell wall hydrolase [Erythrobacter sp.]|nr:cell wall hydrolase [Erythrobacter sp.]
MTGPAPIERCWRDDAPLYAIGALLLIVFAALAIWGEGASERRLEPNTPITAAAPAQAPPPLEALPAAADDEAVAWSQLDPDAARARNAATALAAVGVGTARSFAFSGNGVDRERAIGCLALAALAEAGQSDGDQRAVMQVVLNRVRHPAFANTVCGVVFEGSERATGCQFSFTCDGSLARTYPTTAMQSARRRAAEALGGYVHAPVGNATHYHAEYVWPWWSPRLDKVAVEGPHIFYRWRGYWGTAQALNSRYRGGEPDPLGLEATAETIERPALPTRSFAEDGAAMRTITAGAQDSPRVIERARALCPGEGFCQVYGWTESETIPDALPLSDRARRNLRFSFLPARSGNGEAIFFDCQLFPTSSQGRCMPRARP